MRNQLPTKMVDLLVVLLLVIFTGTIGLSATNKARETAARAKCASNLHQIGLAILLYQNENQQLYPRTIIDATDNPKPTWGTPYQGAKELGAVHNTEPFGAGKTQPAANDITAGLFLLLRNEQITPAVFICPGTKLGAWDFGGGPQTAQDWTNWQGNSCLASHLSYSYQNMYASKVAMDNGFELRHPDATFAIASDMNPGGTAVTTVTMHSTIQQLREANSLNHDKDGQNVLYGDGHAEWVNNPFCGSQHDNIFTAAGPEVQNLNAADRGKAVVLASPVDQTDSILLPTADDIGYKGPPPPKPMTPQAVAKLETDIQGTYNSGFPMRNKRLKAVLTIDGKTIKVVAGPITIQYDYVVTGSDDGALLLKLTAPETDDTASISLEGDSLKFEGDDDVPLNFNWKRMESH